MGTGIRYDPAMIPLILALIAGQTPPVPVPDLTIPAGWRAEPISQAVLLDRLEGIARFLAEHQSDGGAVIDPILGREHQYATPYFAYGVGTLIEARRAEGLWSHGIAAMDHATQCIAAGRRKIPDDHGEFFLAPLADGLALYASAVDEVTMNRWRERLGVPLNTIIEGGGAKINNWRTYAMRGEWSRARAALVSRADTVAFIEDAWLNRTQRERIVGDRWNLYQDWNGHPQSHAVEAVGRGNLLGLILAGYDGPSASEMRDAVFRGTAASLLLQDPTGQCPPNGRTDDHVFNDVLYALAFEAMAQVSHGQGQVELAGSYRRASDLALASIERWRRRDALWQGAYSITKNHFDPADRVGYQPASQVSNYSGAMLYHMAELYRMRAAGPAIEQRPAPAEIGGYVLECDPRFGSAVANAGGMQVFANLLGDSVPKYGDYWTPLGIVRFSREGWDSRLGPSDGARTAAQGAAVTFAPTWQERGGNWVRLADKAEHYRGTFSANRVEKDRVTISILYAPVTGVGGPVFRFELHIDPSGVNVELSSPSEHAFGLSVPLLENDGQPLELLRESWGAGTRYADGGDEQWFIGLDAAQVWADDGPSVRSSCGWIKPLRVTAESGTIRLRVYPRKPGEATAEELRARYMDRN